MPRKNGYLKTANLMINVYDGARKLYGDSAKVLVRLIDGNQTKRYEKYRKGPHIFCRNIPVFDNSGNNYSVIAWAEGCRQIGFTPIKMEAGVTRHISLMLLPKVCGFNFSRAALNLLKESRPGLFRLLCAGVDDDRKAKERYDAFRENNSGAVAAFLNIAEAMSLIPLSDRTLLDFVRELIWSEIKRDRFFAFADIALVGLIERAASENLWAPEIGSSLFHPGATRSFKQIRFGEANVQITFHEKDRRIIGGAQCVKVEMDMDYYKDIAAHTFLEVLPNAVSGGRTDPATVYVLRWMAGKNAGAPEFDPPYIVV